MSAMNIAQWLQTGSAAPTASQAPDGGALSANVRSWLEMVAGYAPAPLQAGLAELITRLA